MKGRGVIYFMWGKGRAKNRMAKGKNNLIPGLQEIKSRSWPILFYHSMEGTKSLSQSQLKLLDMQIASLWDTGPFRMNTHLQDKEAARCP